MSPGSLMFVNCETFVFRKALILLPKSVNDGEDCSYKTV